MQISNERSDLIGSFSHVYYCQTAYQAQSRLPLLTPEREARRPLDIFGSNMLVA